MITYLTHYYRQGDPPFHSLSALCDAEAIAVMESLYEDNPLADRFKEPAKYMNNRRQVEHWVKNEFIAKGGEPMENYPLYAVLGYSHWMEENLTFLELSSLRVPLTISAHYQSQYHGKIFTVILGLAGAYLRCAGR